MRSKRRTIAFLASAILFLAVALPCNAGYAQKPYWTSQADPRMVVIPTRSLQEISTDLANAMAIKQLAVNRNTQAVDRLNEIASSIQDREALLKQIDRRRGDAKANRRNAEATSLKIESEANKQAVDLLKRLKDLRKAEIEVAKVEEDHADIAIRVFRLESELQGKRADYNWNTIGSQSNLTRNTAHHVVSELEVGLLKLQQELANSTQKVASKQKDVVKQRMKLHEAQLALGM